MFERGRTQTVLQSIVLALAFALPSPVIVAAEPDQGPQAQDRGSVRSATVVLQQGDTPAGGSGNSVVYVGAPFTNGEGEVGFLGQFDFTGLGYFVWFDTGIIFVASSVTSSSLLGGGLVMGFSDDGDFIYGLTVDSERALWTDDGLLAVVGMQAPGFPPGTLLNSLAASTMTPSGRAYWLATFDDGGDSGSLGSVLYTSADHQPGSIAPLLRSGDVIDGLTVASLGFYQFADNANHHIQELRFATGSTADDDAVYVDGAVVAREGSPTGDGDNWDEFTLVSINNQGEYVFAGRGDGPTETDVVLAVNGTVAMREGDTVAGVTLPIRVSHLSINNLGQIAYVWKNILDFSLFLSCDANDPIGSAQLVAQRHDAVDLDGDGAADATLFAIGATSSPALQFAEDGKIYLNTSLLYTGATESINAIVAFDAPYCDPPVAINEIRIDQGGSDDDEYFELAGPAGTDLSGLTLVVIGDGTGASGEIEAAIDLSGQSIPADGFWFAAEDADTLGEVADMITTLDFENSDNVTHLLVSGFGGSVGDDLDSDDDCALDAQPWTSLVDGLALVEEANPPTSTECHYGAEAGAQIGPDGAFVPGHVGRDSDLDGPWLLGDFDPAAGTDTPGASNVGSIPVELLSFSVD